MGKPRHSKRKHASHRKLANKSLNKQIRKKKERRDQGKNTRGDVLSVSDTYISQNIERTNYQVLRSIDHPQDSIPDQELDYLLSKGLKNESTYRNKDRDEKKIQDEEVEAEYEKTPRKLPEYFEKDNVEHLLPVKGKNGVVMQTRIKRLTKDAKDESEEEEHITVSAIEQPEEMKTTSEFTMAQLLAERHNHLRRSKTYIAEICHSILGNPQEKIGELKTLVALCEKKELPSVRKIAMLSACELFKDVVPGYRIRSLTQEEKNIKVSKDVKALRDFEETLINAYRKYLDVLEETLNEEIKSAKEGGTEEGTEKTLIGLGIVALKCMADLLGVLSHFNYRTNIIACLVPKMDLSGKYKEVVSICYQAIKELFLNDRVGDISLEVVKLISKYVKPRVRKVHPVVLDVLLYLNVDPELVKGAEQTESKIERLKKKREEIRKMSRMERKRKKLEEKLNKELMETEAVESRSRLQKLHTEILKHVFVVYFRVVKIGRRTPLLTSALKGLSKYAHLINIDFYQDLMKALQSLMLSENLSLAESVTCALTALKILTGQGEALTIDPHNFYMHIYTVLLELSSASDENIGLCCECLDLMLVKRRKQVSFQRMIGFLKRITTTAIQMPSSNSNKLLNLAKSMLQLNRRCDCLLDNESIGRGVFRPELSDPEHSNADGTALWELCLSLKHFGQDHRALALYILKGAPSHGPGSINPHLMKRLSSSNTDPTKLGSYLPSNISKGRSMKSSTKRTTWSSDELESITAKTLDWAKNCEEQMRV